MKPAGASARTAWCFLALTAALLMATPLSAEGPRWRVLEHEKFTFIYEPADEAVAREAYALADEVYARVTASMDYYPEGVPVVIRGRTARANGYYTPFPHQINLFVTSPSGPWLGSREESWIRLLFIHEFTHYVHYANRAGLLGSLSHLFGHDLTAAHAPFYPGWLQEGIPTTNETYYTSGGRGRSPFFTMKYRAFLEEGGLWSYRRSKFGSAYAPQDRIYVAGYLYVDYLRRTYGDEVMAEIHETFARAPILGLPRAVRVVTGVGARELHARMAAELMSEHRSGPAAEGSREGRRRLSPPRPGDWYLPVGTEDGFFFYARSQEDPPGLWRLAPGGAPGGTEVASAEQVLAVSLTDAYSFSVSGDGGTILFASVVPDPGHPAGLSSFSEVYRLDRETSVPQRLTRGGRFWHPAIDPAGQRAVVVSRRGSFSELHRLDPETGETELIYGVPRGTLRHPVFSPTGDRLAFLLQAGGSQELLLADVVDGNGGEPWHLERIRSLTGSWDAPVYMPRFASQEVILFSSDPGVGTEVFAADLASGEILHLLSDPVAAWGAIPASRTGGGSRPRELIYGSYTTTGTTLYLAPANWEPVGELTGGGAPQGLSEAAAGGAGWEGASSVTLPAGGDGGLPEAAVYRDTPRPLLWLPLLGLEGTLDDGPTFSGGTFLLATSTLQRHQLLATALYAPALVQPSLGLDYTFAPGLVGLSVGLTYEYEESDGAASADLEGIGEITVPVLRRYRPGEESRIDGSLGLGLEQRWVSGRSFSLAESRASDVSGAGALFGEAGVSATRGELSAPKAFYGSRSESVAVSVRYLPPLLDRDEQAVEGVARVGLLGGLPWWHHALGVSLRTAASSRGEAARLLSPRGGPGWDRGRGDYELIPSVRYFVPLGLWEGRALGTNFLGGGAFLFAETPFAGNGAQAPEWGREYYLGTEVNLSMELFNVLPVLGTVGVVSRVNESGALDDGFGDLHLYVNVSASIPTLSSTSYLW